MTLTIGDIEEVKEEMCNDYCKLPNMPMEQEELYELCKYCPLNRLEVTIND